jgi:hypothetical protein
VRVGLHGAAQPGIVDGALVFLATRKDWIFESGVLAKDVWLRRGVMERDSPMLQELTGALYFRFSRSISATFIR